MREACFDLGLSSEAYNTWNEALTERPARDLRSLHTMAMLLTKRCARELKRKLETRFFLFSSVKPAWKRLFGISFRPCTRGKRSEERAYLSAFFLQQNTHNSKN